MQEWLKTSCIVYVDIVDSAMGQFIDTEVSRPRSPPPADHVDHTDWRMSGCVGCVASFLYYCVT